MKKIITVEGMSCHHCKNAVEKAVKSLVGVSEAEVDLEARSLLVEFDETKTDLDQIVAAIDDAGYAVA